ELSDIGSPRADDHEHLMLPEMLEDPYVDVALQAPPSPDYIPGPKKPEQAPPSPNYVPGPEHANDEIVAEDQPYAKGPEHANDEIVAEDQPYAKGALPIAHSPEYVQESDFEAHPKDDDDEDSEEDPVDYPTYGGDDGDDEEEEIGYGITNSWDEIVETLQGAPVSTDTELGGYMREFETRVRHDTDEIYMRRAYAYTRQLMETEARMSREAWVRATDASDLVYGEVMSLRTIVLGQMSEIRELQVADRRRRTVISELLRIDHRRSTEISELRTALQGQVIALQAQVTTLQG
nr:hypothetical protein [Tanacetum cinerariifolium]